MSQPDTGVLFVHACQCAIEEIEEALALVREGDTDPLALWAQVKSKTQAAVRGCESASLLAHQELQSVGEGAVVIEAGKAKP